MQIPMTAGAWRISALVLLLTSASCGTEPDGDTSAKGADSGAATDAAGSDAAVVDAGALDASATDTNATGGTDSGAVDTGATGATDTGTTDTGTTDAGTSKPAEMGPSCVLTKPSCGAKLTCKAWTDGKAYCFCPDGQAYKGGLCSGDLTNVDSMCAYTKKDCTGEGYCFDVTSGTCGYLKAKKLTHPGCDELEKTGNKAAAACVSPLTDKKSPYHDSAECPLVQYWSNPSDFPIDCRCAGKFEPPCKRPYNLPPKTSFAEGPRPRDLASTVQAWNGVVVGNEWLLAVGWSTSTKKAQTMVFGVDITTGKRRYVSGTYNDPAKGLTTVGAGDGFVNVMDLKLSADGNLYAVGGTSDIAPPKVWRIDPKTGDRTLLFDEETADPKTLCANGSTLPGKKVVQLVPEGFAMDAAGNFYFAYINMPGRGVVRFPKDFSQCTFLTRVPDTNQSTTLKTPVGAGYDEVQFQLRAFEVVDETLYAISDTKLLAVDLKTGDRTLISNAKSVGGLGEGPINAEGLGDRWIRWDPYRKVLWTYGVKGGSGAVAVDLKTGDRYTWPCWHPTLGIQATCGSTGTALVPGYLNFGGMAFDPAPPHDLIFAHDLFAVVRYEVRTGNAYTFSL